MEKEEISQEELDDLLSTNCNLCVVWKGQLGDMTAVCKFLKERNAYVFYRKASKDHLVVSVKKEGEENGNTNST